MTLASIYWTSQDWLWPAVGFLVVAIFLLWRTYRSVPGNPGLRWTCALLKILGLAALAACLLEPFWSSRKPKPGANYFVVLADNSQGLNMKDPDSAKTRAENLRSALIGPQSTWMDKLEETFKVRPYIFDNRLQAVRDFGEMDFSGGSSGLQTALKTLRERHEGRPLAGILVLTDGNATDWAENWLDLNKLPPVYPVTFGSDHTARDISINNVAVTQTAFEDAPVSVQADVDATGYAGSSVLMRLLPIDPSKSPSLTATGTNIQSAKNPDPNRGTMLEERQIVSKDQDSLSYRFQVRPHRGGVSFFQLQVTEESNLSIEDAASERASEEATLANNRRIIAVDRGQGPYRILYVSGRPNWEFKFLNRALQEDDQVRLVGLIRMARREPKFEFKGRRGEDSNPLFRGFDKKSEETEKYDEAVLVRFNTRDEEELKGGFPKTEEALFEFHALILDDLESDFFSRDQMSLVQRFVSERGGGLLMLGGPDSFQAGNYERTPIGDLLPVYLRANDPMPPPSNLIWQFTREGWLQPWARLRNNERAERTRLADMPKFQILNPATDVKPGAMVLATVTDLSGQKYPALAAQRFGHGRSAALLVGDYWRWGFHEAAMQEDMAQSWRQMVRWLVADVPQRISMQAVPRPNDPNQAVRLEVRVRDEKYQPLDNATVKIKVQFVEADLPSVRRDLTTDSLEAVEPAPAPTPDGSSRWPTIELEANADPAEAGLYEATFIPRHTGGYLATTEVVDPEGVSLGMAEAGWTSDPAAEEFKSLKPNRSLLESIALRTGGEMVAAEDLGSFAANLPDREAPVMEPWTFPLWHQAWVLLFALGCFVAEWGLRRWNGLA